MKTTIISLFVLASILVTTQAKAQQIRYYYYPERNIYYDPGHRVYYYDNGGTWTNVKTLPSGVTVTNIPRYTVYGNREIWRSNAQHKIKYKNYPKGKAVGYKGSNPNKANGKYRKGHH